MWLSRFITLSNWFIKSWQITALLAFTLVIQSSMYTKSACIIVHGTWAKNESWYRPGGDFFQSVKNCNDELKFVDEVVPFAWSGKLGSLAQVQAGQELANFIMLYDSVILIAHSHGSTVGMISSQILSKKFSHCDDLAKITKFYSLGVPVKESWVIPNMNVIQRFYNLFSFGDNIQTINGYYARTFSDCDRIFNLSIELFDLHPSHFQLHHPAIGCYLLKIDDYLSQQSIGDFDNFYCDQPGKIFFFEYQYPQYVLEKDQKYLLHIDREARRLATLAFFRSNELLDEESEIVD